MLDNVKDLEGDEKIGVQIVRRAMRSYLNSPTTRARKARSWSRK
jgi:hypothetical protein